MSIDARRIVVIGTSCAGKTTFARALSDRLALPHVELDALHWGPNWTPRENFADLVRDEASKDAWVMDGNYGVVRDYLWNRAELLIWLDYEMGVVLWRALRRTLPRAWYRTELWSGCRESFRLSFASRDSILLWVLTTWRSRRHRFARDFAPGGRCSHLRVMRFRTPAEADAFLRGSSVDPQPSSIATL